MLSPEVKKPDQLSSLSQEIFEIREKTPDFIPNVSRENEVPSSVSATIFQSLNPVDQYGAAIFASDECGDTMWNEENLNPPSQNQQ